MKTVTSQSNALDPNAQYKASMSILWSAVERSLVNVMRCIPPLRALMRLELPVLCSIRSTLASPVGRKSTQTGYGSTAYSDIGLEARERGLSGNPSQASDFTPSEVDNSRVLRRADVYTVIHEQEAGGKAMI
jgi:hypothetical protein